MMRIVRLRVAVAALGAVALVTATARCGSAQEKVEVEEQDGKAAPFVVSSGGFGGGSYLGVYISEVDAEDVTQLGLKREYGARIEDVSEDSPAQKAGLQADDVIVGWNGSQVESAAQLRRLVTETPAGREVKLEVIRDKKKRDVTVAIGERESMVRSFSFRGPAPGQVEELKERLRSGGEGVQWHSPAVGNVFAFMGGGRMGVGIQSVGDQLGEYFGLDGRNGVLVTSVEEDSPAAEAGLEAGDIILSVGGKPIDGAGDVARAIREAEQGPIAVGILRDRKERNVTVELPEAPEFNWHSDDGEVILKIPEAIEGAMMVVPEILDDLHVEWKGPEIGVRIGVPEAEPVEAALESRVST
jgi:membrane-associated protease RseP (regulator of RpoE activity)